MASNQVGFLLSLRAAETLDEIVVMPVGTVELFGSDPLLMNEAGAKRVIAAFNDQGVDVPIDWEHSSVTRAEKGLDSPAAGWITGFKWDPKRGLVASVNWTDVGATQITAKQYRYLSPVIVFDESTREVNRIHSVALTNKPRTKNQAELLAASVKLQLEKENEMSTDTKGAADAKKAATKEGVVKAQEPVAGGGGSMTDLAIALTNAGVQLPEGADEMAILAAAVQFIKANGGAPAEAAPEGEAAPEAASEALSVLGATSKSEAIMKLKAEYVPRSEHAALSERLATIEGERKAERVEAAIKANIEANKINPRDDEQMTACREMAEADVDKFVKFMAAQPPLIPSGRVVSPNDKVNGGDTRENVILASAREYDDLGKAYKRLTSKKAWINDTLREKSLALMTDEDAGKLGIAVG